MDDIGEQFAGRTGSVKMTFSEPVNEIFEALAKAQAKITNPPRNREVQVVSKRTGGRYTFKYATLDAIIEHVRKPLTENGLWFVQNLEEGTNGKYRLVTHLVHSSGQWVRGETPILAENGGNQAFGSALTYMRRYSLTAMLGVAADEDDDANAADGNSATEKGKGAARKAAPKPDEGPEKALADKIKAYIDNAKDVADVNAIMEDAEQELETIKARSKTAYEFLIQRAETRRAFHAQQPSEAA